jgi:hypothetical protein
MWQLAIFVPPISGCEHVADPDVPLGTVDAEPSEVIPLTVSACEGLAVPMPTYPSVVSTVIAFDVPLALSN